MTATFAERIADLREQVGHDRLRARLTVDQIYAHYQHERADLHHPRGGRAFYLQMPLFEHFRTYLREYADTVLHDGGQRAMEHAAEHLSDEVEDNAPREWGDLMRSGHPEVYQGERRIYDRPPKAGRLSPAELAAKSRAIFRQRLAAGLTVYFMRHGKVMVIPGKHDPHPLRGRL